MAITPTPHIAKEKDYTILDNITINSVVDKKPMELDPSLSVQINNSYSKKISAKARQSYEIRRQIHQFIAEKTLDKDTGEFTDLSNDIEQRVKAKFSGTEYERLANFYYRLGLNQSLYAEFDNTLGLKQTQIISTRYSMHSLCPVWGYRKSQIIRKRYKNYFIDNPQLLKNYLPCHLVLTLRHKEDGFYLNDKFIGKRFFARELIEQFAKFRSDNRVNWKKYVYGATYNTEIKKGKNGLHIHLHCLVLQHKNIDYSEVEHFFKETWKNQTGATQVHYEPLYYYERKQESEEIEKVSFSDDWTIDQTTKSILECLKYNFKGDSLLKDDSTTDYDIEFIQEVLNNSYRLRLTSRMGAFYRVKALNFQEIKEDELPELETDKELALNNYYVGRAKKQNFENVADYVLCEEINTNLEYKLQKDILGLNEKDFLEAFAKVRQYYSSREGVSLKDAIDLKASFNNIINPFTLEKDMNFKIKLAFSQNIKHNKKDHHYSNKPKYHPKNFYDVDLDNISEMQKNLMRGHYRNLVSYDDYDRFKVDFEELNNF